MNFIHLIFFINIALKNLFTFRKYICLIIVLLDLQTNYTDYMYEKNYEEAKKYYEKVLEVFPLSNSANIALKVIEEKLK